MSEENWDNPEEVQPPDLQKLQIRRTGMRGRGFVPYEDISSPGRNYANPKPTVHHVNGLLEYEKKNESNGYPDYEDNEESKESQNGSRNYSNFPMSSKSENGFIKKKGGENKGRGLDKYNVKKDRRRGQSSIYNLHDNGDCEDYLFSNGISSGINFDKFDDIQVNVTGENIPKNIKSFAEAGLCPLLNTNILKCSYTKPTPVQKIAIPIIMNGRDMMACSQTGSGKTAAFLIPIINNLLQEEFPATEDGTATPQLVVISPTRELAIQTYLESKKFTYGSKLKTEICYGGTEVRNQFNRVRAGCNILVATIGRLLDFLERRVVFSLKAVRYVVIDEADRMLDLNFLPEVEKFLNNSTWSENNRPQILLFSATFPEDIQRLAQKILKNYLFVAVGVIGGACSDVVQKFYCVSKFDKRAKLIELLKENGSDKTLVFVEKKRTADIIAAFLSEKDIPTTSMHGGREQDLREEALNDFRTGKMKVLVATAVVGRGLDIKNVSHVINFDLPKSIDEYVHRIGRTGRIGHKGLATSFFDPCSDSSLASDLIRILAQAQQEVPDFIQERSRSWTGPLSNHGGNDIRKFGKRENKTGVLETAPVYEEEVW